MEKAPFFLCASPSVLAAFLSDWDPAASGATLGDFLKLCIGHFCADLERLRGQKDVAEEVDFFLEGPAGLPIWRCWFTVSGPGCFSPSRPEQREGQHFLRNIHLQPVSSAEPVCKFHSVIGSCCLWGFIFTDDKHSDSSLIVLSDGCWSKIWSVLYFCTVLHIYSCWWIL